MAKGGRKNKKRGVVSTAIAGEIHKFKYELASELGENSNYYGEDWVNLASREMAVPDGRGIRQMIAKAEVKLQAKEGGFK